MKNYKVVATRNFTDGLEKEERIKDKDFYCTKERYEFLKSKGAVELIEIIEEKKEEITEEPIQEIIEPLKEDEIVEQIITKKKKSSKK